VTLTNNSIDQLIILENNSEILPIYTLPDFEKARIVAEWTVGQFDPRRTKEYLRIYEEAKTRFSEARRLEDLRKQEAQVKKDTELGERILDLLKSHLCVESHTGQIVELDGEYAFEPVEVSGIWIHDSGESIDPLPKLSCKFRGTKYKVKDLIATHLAAMVDQINNGQLSLSVVALSAKLLNEKVIFACPVCQQSDCPRSWRNKLQCGSATLKIRPK